MKTNDKRRTTLFFTDGSALTPRDVKALNSIPGGAYHRNASLINADDKLEPCDAVAGDAIPAQYADIPEVEIDWDAIDAEVEAEANGESEAETAPATGAKAKRKRKTPAAT